MKSSNPDIILIEGNHLKFNTRNNSYSTHIGILRFIGFNGSFGQQGRTDSNGKKSYQEENPLQKKAAKSIQHLKCLKMMSTIVFFM